MAPAADAALLRTAVVCASNMNRSMEAHRVFRLAGMDVRRVESLSVALKVSQQWRLPNSALGLCLLACALNRSPPSAWDST